MFCSDSGALSHVIILNYSLILRLIVVGMEVCLLWVLLRGDLFLHKSLFRELYWVASKKLSPLVCPHKLSHDSKHDWRLAVTHTAPCDRFGERADTRGRMQQLPPRPPGKKHRKQHCASSTSGLLSVPMAAPSEGEAAC